MPSLIAMLLMYMCNELGGGRRRLYSDATGVGRSGSHKEQQTHSGDGIWWFNDYKIYGPGLQYKPVTTGDYITDPHKSWGAGWPVSVDRDDLSQPYSDLSPDYISDFP